MNVILFFLLTVFFLCYGSFLNTIAYRIINGQNFIYARSFCPSCKKTIAWYDLIPLFSWIFLKGKCRTCKNSISFLYPLIEILTAIIFILMVLFIKTKLWPIYTIFFTSLIITIRTDLEYMLISQFFTIYILPIAFFASFFNLVDITFTQSLIGAIFGYLILLIINKIYLNLKGRSGIGEGDFELLAMIGGFTGIFGMWYSLFFGALLGTLFSILLLIQRKSLTTKIPFAPFLCFGSIIFIFLKKFLLI